MERHFADIHPKVAEALGLSSYAQEAVARKLAEIGGLRTPTRPESVEFLVSTLRYALKEIPIEPAAWSWAEFHHAGIYPAHQLAQSSDPVELAICAADLGMADEAPPGPAVTPRRALSQNLMAAANQLLRNLETQLEGAGISAHGHKGLA